MSTCNYSSRRSNELIKSSRNFLKQKWTRIYSTDFQVSASAVTQMCGPLPKNITNQVGSLQKLHLWKDYEINKSIQGVFLGRHVKCQVETPIM